MSRIAIIGAGGWGTGLAIALSRKGRHHICLWAREKEVCESIMQTRINQQFLPDFSVPQEVQATTDYKTALDGAQIVISVVPS